VWIPRPVHRDAVRLLRAHADVHLGYDDGARNGAVDFDATASELSAILLRTERVDGDMMRRAPRLRIVARHGVGLDTVDLDTARELGIAVTNTPTANARSVAEHTFALLLAVRRGIGLAIRDRGHGGEDARAAIQGRELFGSTLGLIGFGRIAEQVAAIGRLGFGMRVLAHDPLLADEAISRRGAEPTCLPELLASADAVSVHVPLTSDTRDLLGLDELMSMRPGAVVINTARGGIVDEDALSTALRRGHLGGAGLDVTTVEPLPWDHPLRAEPSVVITPHIGAQTSEAMRRMAMEAAQRIIEHLRA